MSQKERWIYDEMLMKRWGMSSMIFFTIVERGLPIYDSYGQRFEFDPLEGNENTPYMFKMDDVEKYEEENPHLFGKIPKGLDAKEK